VPFQPGQSGNPAGRPPGSRNRRSLVSEVMIDGEAEALVRRAIDQGLDGDLRAIRLLLDRLEPARKERPLDFALPPLEKYEDGPAVYAAIAAALSRGELTPGEAESLSRIIDRQVAVLEANEIKKLIEATPQAHS
jgi:hypothetical protein